ncbi:helix-turn-helix domain-containing protein [Streptomyces sp. NPDC048389]|uniref:helix-turn-helix domain-containing protein n=1 Tax=Streptomyces sp. NPDC048389 TaxID=3154622 RepID=UPI0034531302
MTNATVAARRATVARMSRDGASLRAIAAHLGVGKDTVRRDLAAAKGDTVRQPDQHIATDETPCDTGRATGEAPGETPRPSRAQRVAEADAAMRQLGQAVAAAVAARPSHVIVCDTVARGWADGLRHHAAALARLAAAFDEYYPPPAEQKSMDSNNRSTA